RQPLRGYRTVSATRHQPFEQHPLVREMLIDDQQSRSPFSRNEAVPELRDRPQRLCGDLYLGDRRLTEVGGQGLGDGGWRGSRGTHEGWRIGEWIGLPARRTPRAGGRRRRPSDPQSLTPNPPSGPLLLRDDGL